MKAIESKTNKKELRGTLYVPAFELNLLYVAMFIKTRMKLEFEKKIKKHAGRNQVLAGAGL